MSKKAISKTKATEPAEIVIANKEEFKRLIDRIAVLQVDIEQIESKKEADLQKVLKDFEVSQEAIVEGLEKIKEELARTLKACELFAATRRDDLFDRGKKSACTTIAKYGYKLGQPALATLKGWTFPKVTTLLLKTRRKVYVTLKPQLNKDTLRAKVKPSKLAKIGLRIEQAEEFYVSRLTEEES